MKIHRTITDERVIQAIDEDCGWGFCVFCGSEIDQVDPDEEKHLCELCGKPGVYGAQALLFHLVP